MSNVLKSHFKANNFHEFIAYSWNDWPTIEESFGAGLQPQSVPTMKWPQMLPTAPTIKSTPELLPSAGQWTTSFWNINKMTEMEAIQSADINNNKSDCFCGYQTPIQPMTTSNSYGFNPNWYYDYRRAQPPIGTRLNRQHYNGD